MESGTRRVSRVPVPVLIEYTLNYLLRDTAPAPVHSADDSARWCEALYALEDKRHA